MCIDPVTGVLLAVSAGASIIQGADASAAANEKADYVVEQKATEQQIAAVEEGRVGRQWQTEIAKQASDIAAAGFQQNSPTALVLAREAAKEMVFAKQSVRSQSTARSAELTATERNLRAQASEAMLGGFVSAAGTVLTQTQSVWPDLLK